MNDRTPLDEARLTLGRIVHTVASGEDIPRAQLVADAGLLRRVLNDIADDAKRFRAALETLVDCIEVDVQEGEIRYYVKHGRGWDFQTAAAAAVHVLPGQAGQGGAR